VLHTLPVGFVSMLTTGLLGLGDKLEVAKLLAGLPRLDATGYASTSVRSWIDASLAGARARSLLEALVRVTTYADAPALQSAGHAIDLMQLVLRTNVRYVDSGWQVIVDALRAATVAAGARIVTGARAVGIDRQGATVRAVKLEDGASLPAETVVVATTPASAARLSGSATLAAWAARARPAKAACLDVALSSLPVARATFALGIDRPLYLSVHSTTAGGLAPEGGALVHLAKYLDPDVQHDADADRAELEVLMDRVQPGWREHVVSARFLPALTVTHAIPLAAEHGTRDRPRPELADAPSVLVAGDWVGDGHLAEASLLSAKIAAESIRTSARPTSEGAAAA
jgi:phytoene dehydrogenase-like protein